jgi:hypothetical protein
MLMIAACNGRKGRLQAALDCAWRQKKAARASGIAIADTAPRPTSVGSAAEGIARGSRNFEAKKAEAEILPVQRRSASVSGSGLRIAARVGG